jgi:effector-binding domain-containing protein
MKIIKFIGLGLLVLIILLVIVAFLLPRNVRIQRSITMKSDQEIVFEQINTLRNWEQWSPWHKIDPKMKLVYGDIPSGKDAFYSWSSEERAVGKGKLTITKSVPYDTINVTMDFMEQGISSGGYNLKKVDSLVRLTWWMEADMGNNPIGRIMGLFLDKIVGKDFDKGLKNLKEICERLGNTPLKGESSTEKPSTYLYIHTTCIGQELPKFYGNAYTKLAKYIVENKAKPTGPPFSLYYKWEKNEFVLDACMGANKPLKGNKEIKSGKLTGGNIYTVNYYGPYEGTGRAHEMAMNWLKNNKHQLTGAPREVYQTDPMTEKDPAKWLTLVVYPFK